MGVSGTGRVRGCLGGGGGGGGGGATCEVAALGLEAGGRRALLDALGGGGGDSQPCRLEVSGRWVRVSACTSVAARAHALIFVVDATDSLRIVLCRDWLSRCLARSRGAAPLLVLVAHTDKPHALPIDKLAQGLGLGAVWSRGWHIAPLSAVRDALTWLVAQTPHNGTNTHTSTK